MMNANLSHLSQWACILILTFVCFPAHATAQNKCVIAAEFQELVVNLNKTGSQTGQVSDAQLLQNTRSVSKVRSSRLMAELKANGRIAEKRVVLQVLYAATEISRFRQVTDRNELNRTLNAAQRLIASICNGALGLPNTGSTTADREKLESGGFILTRLNGAEGYLNIIYFMLVLLGVIGALLLAQAIYLRVFALVFCRKSCRIEAKLVLGAETIAGHITIVGKKGCRFQPHDRIDIDRLEGLTGAKHASVIVADFAIPLNIFAVTESFIANFFVTPIKYEILAQILEKSVVRTHYAKKEKIPPKRIVFQPKRG